MFPISVKEGDAAMYKQRVPVFIQSPTVWEPPSGEQPLTALGTKFNIKLEDIHGGTTSMEGLASPGDLPNQ